MRRYATRREAREAAASVCLSLRNKGLAHLADALETALRIDLDNERAVLRDRSQENVAVATEAHHSLAYWLNVCEGTISELRSATITHSDGEVHVMGQTYTPQGACKFAQQITEHAYHATKHVNRAVELTRKALGETQPVETH